MQEDRRGRLPRIPPAARNRKGRMMRVAAGPWYEINKVDHGLSRILERHVAPWMRCNMWLIHGRNRNLLIDSGMGLRPLKAEISALGERPVATVCTHCHFDHIGCSHE